MKTVIDIIKNSGDKKFLIFSSYQESFNLIRNTLSDNEITYAEIRGQYQTRNRNIEKFKEGKIKVIFLNSKNNGGRY